MIRLCVVAAALVATGAFASPVRGEDERRAGEAAALARLESPPLGLPPVPVPPDNPPTAEKIALGRKLFFDRRLSFNNTMSCGMCHIPEQGFTSNELATPVGVEGRSLRRNAPTVVNVAYVTYVFHDGRDTSLETQAINPLLARDEMANPSMGWLIAKIEAMSDYDGLFESAFAGGPTVDRIGMAIASWERTLLAGDSRFDRWRYGGEKNALDEEEKRGFALFTGKAGCGMCHTMGSQHALLTDGLFHNTGIARRPTLVGGEGPVPVEVAPGQVIGFARDLLRSISDPRPPDLGRFEVTLDPGDRWRFRTPSLRNVALTAPYMHDGSLRTLEGVVDFYDRGGDGGEGMDPRIVPLGLTEDERASLVAFLRSLTSPAFEALREDGRRAPVGDS